MKRRMHSRSIAWIAAVSCVLLAGLTPGQSAASYMTGTQRPASAGVAPLDLSSATAGPTLPPTAVLSGTATAQASAPAPTNTTTDSATPPASASPQADPSAPGTDSPTPLLSIVPSTLTPAPSVLPPTSTALPTALPSDTPVTATEAPIPAITGGDLLALPLAFEANQGQSPSDIRYVAHMGPATAFFTAQQAVLALSVPLSSTGGITSQLPLAGQPLTQTASMTTAVVSFQLSAGTPQLSGTTPLSETATYLIGNDPSQWQRGVPTYGGVQYSNVAPGVTLTYTGTGGQLESTYTVAPGADPSSITLTISGTTGLALDGAGNLVLHTAVGDLTLSAPAAYQTINGQQQAVSVQYTLLGSNAVSFSVGAYDSSRSLIIDPVLAYSPTVLGGSADDEARAVALDAQGNIYVTGNTASSDLRTVNGLYSYQGNGDAFVAKLSPDGQHVLYSTFLGGNDPNNNYGADYGLGIAVDSADYIYVAGQTWSANFPTKNPYQPAPGNVESAFVTELSPDGRSLVYSTYLGGSAYATAAALALGPGGTIDVAGTTYGSFPTTTATAFQPNFGNGTTDAFLSVLAPSQNPTNQLVYSTYLGGSGDENGNGVAVDAHGNAYMVGSTTSTNFPTSAAAAQGSNGGGTGTDGFITKINTTASGSGSLIYSTYLGGSGTDAVNAVAINDLGATVTGQTNSSSGFPLVNALQSTFGGGTCGSAPCSDAFVTQINASGTAFSYSTYLGGSNNDNGYGVALGGRGGVFVTGLTGSSDFVTTPDAVQPTSLGPSAFVTELFPTYGGSASLLYSTYLTGSVGTGNPPTFGWAITADAQGNAVVVGTVTNASKDAFIGVFHASPSCPSGLDCTDVGDTALLGDQALTGSRTDGTWTIQGVGTGISGGAITPSSSDQFHYLAQDTSGDTSIIARLDAESLTSTAQAGLMYRSGEDPAAPFLAILVSPNVGGYTIWTQGRASTGATGLSLNSQLITALPIYLRLQRTTDSSGHSSIEADTSPDGLTWTALISGEPVDQIETPHATVGLVVAAGDAVSTNQATFDHVTINTCLAGWNCADVGNPAVAGTQSAPGDQDLNGDISSFAVQGAGTDFGGSGGDQFHYLYTPLSGDGSISARVSGLTGPLTSSGPSKPDPNAKAGVLLRLPGADTTDASDPLAPYYAVLVMPGQQIIVQYRTTEGGAVQTVSPPTTGSTPVYLRADRNGTGFTAYMSSDSVTWTPIQNANVAIPSMSSDLLAGLAVTSHNGSDLDTASFDYVRVDACPDSWTCGDIGVPSVPGTQYLSNGVWSLQGTGTSQSRYVWQSVSGNSGLAARITRQVDTNPYALAGLMYSDPSTGAYYIAGMTPNNGLVVQERPSATGSVVTLAWYHATTLPLYLLVTRNTSTNTFTTYTSPDDASWTPVINSAKAISMAASVELGFDVTAGSGTASSVATFDTAEFDSLPPPSTTPVGSDLTALDTHTEHYTQASGGLIDLKLYNSPAGEPGQSQWLARDTSLTPVAGTNYLSPATMPFTEEVAAASSGLGGSIAAQAALTNEDGLTLSVGMTTTLPSATGTVQSNGVTYARVVQPSATPTPPASDLSMRATISGMDARVVLHSAAETGPFVLTLASTATMQLVQDPSGAIEVTVPYSYYDSTDTAIGSYTRTEYTLQPPILLDSSAAVTAPVSTGPATATVSGANTVTVSVDRGWLTDAHRVFPATLDLPIATTYSLYHTGILGTVNSCQPTQPSPLTDMVVGSLGGCTYNGQVYFDLSVLPPHTPIISATLHLYTPVQTTTTGVQVYSNTAPSGAPFDPTIAPTWNSAPTYTGTGSAQGGSDGHWQSWDVTSFVQGWSSDSSTNAGLTLVSSGAPISFTSPLGAANEPPAYAPYLDITYNPDPAASGVSYNDGAANIYGVSGSFSVRNVPPSATGTPQAYQTPSGGRSHSFNCPRACSGLITPRTIQQNLKGAFMRVGVNIPCGTDAPGATSYWHIQPPLSVSAPKPFRPSMMLGSDASIIDVMQAAYDNNIIPIVDFTIPAFDPKQPNNPDCRTLYSPEPGVGSPQYQTHWENLMRDFMNSLPQSWRTGSFPKHMHLYFEIGNEKNFNGDTSYYNPGTPGTPTYGYYPQVFSAAALGLYNALGSRSDYTILTGGMLNPAVNDTIRDPSPPAHGLNNHQVAAAAIRQAIATPVSVPASVLGLAVHPYHYTTMNASRYWRNFYTEYGLPASSHPGIYVHNQYTSANDLEQMINLWRGTSLLGTSHPLPVVFTEIAWSSHPEQQVDAGDGQFCSDGDQGCLGTYLADLLTYLHDQHHWDAHGSAGTAQVPIRVMWFRGADKPPHDQDVPSRYLGLYGPAGSPKEVVLRLCGNPKPNTHNTDGTTVATDGHHANNRVVPALLNQFGTIGSFMPCY